MALKHARGHILDKIDHKETSGAHKYILAISSIVQLGDVHVT